MTYVTTTLKPAASQPSKAEGNTAPISKIVRPAILKAIFEKARP